MSISSTTLFSNLFPFLNSLLKWKLKWSNNKTLSCNRTKRDIWLVKKKTLVEFETAFLEEFLGFRCLLTGFWVSVIMEHLATRYFANGQVKYHKHIVLSRSWVSSGLFAIEGYCLMSFVWSTQNSILPSISILCNPFKSINRSCNLGQLFYR